jgi:hypothetical protein
VGHGAKLDQKRDEAIIALLTHGSIERAARAVGVDPNTLQRWMKEPEFVERYREAGRIAFDHSLGLLQQASGAAVTTVLKIMFDSIVAPLTRLRAAEIVLDHAGHANEISELKARLEKLERAGGSGPRSDDLCKADDAGGSAMPGAAATPLQIAAPQPRLIPEPAHRRPETSGYPEDVAAADGSPE